MLPGCLKHSTAAPQRRSSPVRPNGDPELLEQEAGAFISFLEKRQLDLLSIVPGFRLGLDRVPKPESLKRETHSV